MIASSRTERKSELRPLIMLGVVLLLSSSPAFLASCDSSGETPATIYGDPPALEDYRSSLAQLEPWLQEESSLYPGRAVPTEEEYRALIEAYRQQGLRALPEKESKTLLLVAQLAFVSHADTLRYVVTSEKTADTTDEVASGEAILEEVYQQVLVQSAQARRIRGGGISWHWTVEPRPDPDAAEERLEFFDWKAETDGAARFLTIATWEKHAGGWECGLMRFPDDYSAMVQLAHVLLFAGYSLGDLVDSDAIGGKPAYRFRGERPPRYIAVTYWLDAETLWLRQYEFEEDGVRYRVKLEAVNEDIVIEPPDVDVECVEEEPE